VRFIEERSFVDIGLLKWHFKTTDGNGKQKARHAIQNALNHGKKVRFYRERWAAMAAAARFCGKREARLWQTIVSSDTNDRLTCGKRASHLRQATGTFSGTDDVVSVERLLTGLLPTR
jgi:hypothetical protein